MSTYAFSDIHGNMSLFKAIQDFLKDDDICYCLGDCADRGPDGWAIIKEVMRDPRIKYIKGNHEDFLVHAMSQFYSDGITDYDFMLWMQNGGEPTYTAMLADQSAEQWVYPIKRLPIYEKYVNKDGIIIHLSHAGFNPKEGITENITSYSNMLLWDRDHIMSQRWNGEDKELVVHGHTPTEHLCRKLHIPFEDGAVWYLNNHKIDIDCGTIITNKTVLLDLDTLDETIFQL